MLSSSSLCGCCVPRPLGESGGRAERVWIGLDGNCCASPSRWPALRVASSSRACFSAITHCLPGLPACWAPAWSRTRAHACFGSAEAPRGREGRGRRGGSTLHSSPGPLGQPGAGHAGRGDSPGFQLLSSPPSQFEEGYLKTGTPAGPGEEQERETGGWDCRQPGSRVHPGAGRSGAPGTDRAAGAGGARGYFVLLCPASSPAEVRERQGRGLSREGAQLSQNKAWTATTPRTPWVRREAKSQRSELFPSVPTSVSFSLSLLKWVICWFI